MHYKIKNFIIPFKCTSKYMPPVCDQHSFNVYTFYNVDNVEVPLSGISNSSLTVFASHSQAWTVRGLVRTVKGVPWTVRRLGRTAR